MKRIIGIFGHKEVKMFRDITPKWQRKTLNYLSKQFRYKNFQGKKIFFINDFVLTFNWSEKDNPFWELEVNGLAFEYPQGEFGDLVLFQTIQSELAVDDDYEGIQ